MCLLSCWFAGTTVTVLTFLPGLKYHHPFLVSRLENEQLHVIFLEMLKIVSKSACIRKWFSFSTRCYCTANINPLTKRSYDRSSRCCSSFISVVFSYMSSGFRLWQYSHTCMQQLMVLICPGSHKLCLLDLFFSLGPRGVTLSPSGCQTTYSLCDWETKYQFCSMSQGSIVLDVAIRGFTLTKVYLCI